MPTTLFLSHAVADAKLAELLTRLLGTGFGLTGDAVFCSSLPGRTIPGGFDFIDHIKKSLEESKVVVLLLTENYLASQFCLAEIGAAWISKEDVIPLVVRPFTRGKLKATLSITQAWKLDDDDDLNSFADDLVRVLEIKINNAQWGVEKRAFLESVQTAIANQKPPTVIDPSEFEKLKDELSYAEESISELRIELEGRDKLIGEIKKLKDTDEVRAIELANLNEMEAFEQIASELSTALNELPSAASEAVFHSARGESLPAPEFGYTDSEDEWRDIRTACKKNMLSDEEPFTLNGDHPKVRKALDALSRLSDFMDFHESELRALIEAEYDLTYSLHDEDFWRQFIG